MKILQLMIYMMIHDKHWILHPIACYCQAKHEIEMGNY